MSRLLGCQLDRGNQTVDHQLKAKVEDSNDDKFGHDAHLEVNAFPQLVNFVVVDAALLGLEQIARFTRVLEYNHHQDQVESIENDRDEEFHALDVD